MLRQLIYCSKTDSFNEDTLVDIFKQSVHRNYVNNIKGFLFVINKKSFVQILQGPIDKVNHLYNSIVRDERHYNVTLLDYKRIPSYNLSYWNIRSLVDESHNSVLNDIWKMILDSKGYINPALVSEKILFESIFYRDIEFDNFDNCLYDFKLVSDLFNIISESNSLELMQNLHLYHQTYDNHKNLGNAKSFELLKEAKIKLKQTIYSKYEKSRP